MHCKQLDKTTWVCVADGPRNKITGKRKQISRRAETKKKAEKRVLDALESLKENGSMNSRITFGDLAIDYLNLLEYKGLKNTTLKLRNYSTELLNGYLKDVAVCDITPAMYQKILNELSSRYSKNTMNAINSMANMVFKYAVQLDLIRKSPCSGVFIPTKKPMSLTDRDEEIMDKYFSKDELKAFINETERLKNKVVSAYFFILAFTGMRPGELLALQKKDINLELKEIKINKTLHFETYEKYELTPPKTLQSNRTILVDDHVINKINQMYDFQRDNQFANSSFAIHNKDGHPLRQKTLNALIKSICKRANIEKQANTYMLRHTHVSLLAEAQVPLIEIAERVGHKNDKMTVAVYLHVTKNMKKRTSHKLHEKLSELLNSD